jgi:hypothetical protein
VGEKEVRGVSEIGQLRSSTVLGLHKPCRNEEYQFVTFGELLRIAVRNLLKKKKTAPPHTQP